MSSGKDNVTWLHLSDLHLCEKRTGFNAKKILYVRYGLPCPRPLSPYAVSIRWNRSRPPLGRDEAGTSTRLMV